ncbi:MAG: DUF6263 family protein [Phycisphaerales bacterium]
MRYRFSAIVVAGLAGGALTLTVAAQPPPSSPGSGGGGGGGAGSGPVEVPSSKPKANQPAPAKSDGKVDLRPKFELGDVVRYTLRQTSDQVVPNQADPKDPNKTHQERTIGLKMSTKAVDKETGEATVEIVYETVKAKIDGPLGLVEFDSTKPPAKGTPTKKSDDPLDAINDAVLESFKKMVGTTMTMKVAKDGRIISITGGESLAPDIIPGLTQAWGDSMKQLGGLFGPINSKSSAGFDGTARVGERWTHTDGVTLGPLGGLDILTNYELRSAQGSVAKVYFTGLAQKKSAGEGSPIAVDDAKHNGQYAWDTRRGQLISCEMEQTVTMSGALTHGKPSTAVTTLKLERTDKK